MKRDEEAGEQDALGVVLIVDDEPSIRRIVRRILERRGYRVIEAESGVEALALVAERSDLAVALVDFSMPGLDGLEVLARLGTTAPRLPVVLMSGYREEASSASGAAGFLSKPFDAAGLMGAIEAAVGAG